MADPAGRRDGETRGEDLVALASAFDAADEARIAREKTE